MDEAIDWIGVLSAIHGLLPIIYRLWFKQVTGKEPPPLPAHGGAAGAADPVLMDADPEPGDGDDQEADAAGDHVADANADADAQNPVDEKSAAARDEKQSRKTEPLQ